MRDAYQQLSYFLIEEWKNQFGKNKFLKNRLGSLQRMFLI